MQNHVVQGPTVLSFGYGFTPYRHNMNGYDRLLTSASAFYWAGQASWNVLFPATVVAVNL